MKNQLGIKALSLISLCMFAWSGWIYAADPKIEDAWTREDPGRIWTVTKKGGHMEVGDMFSIEQSDGPINLVPDPDLKDRWKSEISKVKLKKTLINGQNFLCGFVNVETGEHNQDVQSFTQFRHGKWHGFLIKVKKRNELMIIWSPRSLGDGSSPDPANCEELEVPVRELHGGMAHAKG